MEDYILLLLSKIFMYIQILLPLSPIYWKCTSEDMWGSLWNTGEVFGMLMLKEEKNSLTEKRIK